MSSARHFDARSGLSISDARHFGARLGFSMSDAVASTPILNPTSPSILTAIPPCQRLFNPPTLFNSLLSIPPPHTTTTAPCCRSTPPQSGIAFVFARDHVHLLFPSRPAVCSLHSHRALPVRPIGRPPYARYYSRQSDLSPSLRRPAWSSVDPACISLSLVCAPLRSPNSRQSLPLFSLQSDLFRSPLDVITLALFHSQLHVFVHLLFRLFIHLFGHILGCLSV
jgi:hypothetical protein